MNTNWIRAALFAAASLGGVAHAQVTPPPLPPGSNLVRVEPGLNEEERKRHVRAHHHKFHHGKDVTRDDSVHGHESQQPVVRVNAQQPGAAAGAGAGAAGSRSGGSAGATGGAGTGPAREKTDRGAGSWFFGEPQNKK